MDRRAAVGLIITILVLSAFSLQGCSPAASLVIGQPDFRSNFENQRKNAPDNNTLNNPGGQVAIYHDSLYVTDSLNNRILVFSPVPDKNNPSASRIIQSTDPGKWRNLYEPYGVGIAKDKMFIADEENNRVLIWNTVPTRDETPDIVLGQVNLTDEPIGDCSHMYAPRGIHAANDKLVVSEMNNHRVLIWNSLPTRTNRDNPIAADLALGNADCSPDTAGSTRHAFYQPRGVWTDNTRLVVADTGNHRVMIWSRFPTRSTDDADIVLGTGKAGAGQHQFNGPYAVTSDGTRLFVTDSFNNRVLIWDRFPTKDGDPPTGVLGQSDFERSGANGAPRNDDAPGRPTAATMNAPKGVYYHNNQLWVTDSENHRILRYDIKK